MDEISVAVISWLTSQLMAGGQAKLARLLGGDKQKNALRKIVREAVHDAVAETVDPADREHVEDALLREGLTVLADFAPLSAALERRISAGIQADAARNGPLGPVAEWLRHTETIRELRAIADTLRQPAPESAIAVVHTLPADNLSFTGRAAELSRIEAAAVSVAGSGIVAIDGMAGVGKTAFAVHAAHRIADRFPDGQIFIRMHGHTPGQQPTEPAAALSAALGSLGISGQQIPPGPGERAALWRDLVAGKRVLLVLDDATGTDQVLPLLPGTGGTLVLITSRRRLTLLPEALAITLDVLGAGEAASLLARLAGRDDPSASATGVSALGVSDVARLCGYLPLAISLTAGHLKHHPAWTMADLVDDLESATSRVTAIRAENASVAAAFDLSYRELADSQRLMFRRLGVLPGPEIDAYAAAVLADVGLAAARALLDDLYVAHLLDEPTRGRYRPHDLIREHAVDLARSDDAESAAAAGRLLDYYLHCTQTADKHLARRSHTSVPVAHTTVPAHRPDLSTPERAVAWMEAERANLHAAVRYAASQGKPAYATALAVSMHGFLRTHGYWDQALELHRVALAAARSTGDRLSEAETLNNLGVIQRLIGDYTAAGASLAQALELYRGLGSRLGEANALNYLGVIQRLTADLAQAAESFSGALGIYAQLGDLIGQANALYYLGVLQHATGELRDAAASQRRALRLYRQRDDRLGEADALLDLGVVQRSMTEYPAASRSLKRAFCLYQEIGSRLGQANALKYLGSVHTLSGDYPAATASLNDALELYQQLGSWRGQTDTLGYLSTAQEAGGDHSAAAESLARARELEEKFRHP